MTLLTTNEAMSAKQLTTRILQWISKLLIQCISLAKAPPLHSLNYIWVMNVVPIIHVYQLKDTYVSLYAQKYGT